tara:strand:+ start:485 stop:601 length:117 start_codon:yes stop_codon:yes gene_type:complete
MLELLIFIGVAAYIIAEHKKIITEFKILWKKIKGEDAE